MTISAHLRIFNCEDNFFTCVGWWFATFRCPSHILSLLRCRCGCCVRSRFVFLCTYACARLFITAVQKATKDGFINGTVVWRTHTHTHMIPLLKVTPTCHQSDDWHLRQPIMECERSWLLMNKTLADWLVIWFKSYLAFFSCRLLLADSCCGVKCRAIMSECVFIQTHFDNKSSFRFSLSRAREASCFERWMVKVKPRAEVREGM